LEAASQELDAAYARAVEIGLPLTLEEANGPIVPDEDNIVSGLRPLLTEWKQNWKPDVPLEPSEPRPADMAAIDDAFLAQADEILWRPKAQFLRSSLYSPSYNTLEVLDSSKYKQAAKALVWRARERAMRGDSDGASQDLKRARRLAWAMGQDVTLIGGLVAIAIDGIAVEHVPSLAEDMRGDRRSLARLREAVQSSSPQISMRQSMRMEAFYAVDLARNLKALGGLNIVEASFGPAEEDDSAAFSEPPAMPKLQSDGKPSDLEGRASLARALQVWSRIWASPAVSNFEFAKVLSDAQRRLAEHEESDRSYLVASLMFPMAEEASWAFIKSEVRHELAIAGLRVMEHRALTGQLPQSLREAGAVDKVQGREIHYAVKDGAFCVWTNGPDGVDRGPHFARSMPSVHGGAWLTFPPIP
jgi:hypothetical protein